MYHQGAQVFLEISEKFFISCIKRVGRVKIRVETFQFFKGAENYVE
jgi:hypothetical protein